MSEISLKDKIDELRNINDKLSSALESAENRINKAIEYINSLSSKGKDCEIYYDIKQEILKRLKGDK